MTTDPEHPHVHHDMTKEETESLHRFAKAIGEDPNKIVLAHKLKTGQKLDEQDLEALNDATLGSVPKESDGSNRLDVGTARFMYGQFRVQVVQHCSTNLDVVVEI